MDFNPKLVVVPEQINNKTFYIIRDDKLIGGTKQRMLEPIIKSHHDTVEFVYAGPVYGYAQIALSYIASKLNKKATLFLAKTQPLHHLTEFAKQFNPKIVEIEFNTKFNTKLKDVQKAASLYVKSRINTYLLPFGLSGKENVEILAEQIKKANNIINPNPKRIWLVAGSATLLNALYIVFPNTFFNVVQVGKKVWPDQLDETRTKLYTSDQKFWEEAKILPPYPTVRTYDAKVWIFVMKYGEDGDYVWNVGKDTDRDNSLYRYKDVNSFVKAVNQGTVGFPYKRLYFSDDKIYKMFDNLKKYRYNDRLVNKQYKLRNIDLPESKLQFLGKQTVLLTKEEDYLDFNTLSDTFQEHCRMFCKVYKLGSPINYYFDNTFKLATDCLRNYSEITPYNMRETLYKFAKECTSHRPSLLVSLVQMFKSKSVLDVSAGWGDRLIGSLAASVDYVGVDPNNCLHAGYQMMINYFSNNKNKYTVLEGRFEDENLLIPTDRKYDLVYTSPPYFDLEVYSDTAPQSVSDYKDENAWFNHFLKPALSRAWSLLENEGLFTININQKQGERYVNNMIDFINSFKDSVNLGVISYSNTQLTNPQPIWIWKKSVYKTDYYKYKERYHELKIKS